MNDEMKMKEEFIAKQKELFKKICLDNKVNIDKIKTVAGVDLAYWKKDNIEYACCCIVLIDYNTKEVIEKKTCTGKITVPYIPGCLAFREYDLVEKTVNLLENEVDLFVFDGNGYLHPNHMGLATHAGILLNKASIGVAKSLYKFCDVDYSDLGASAYSYKDIIINEEIYGRILRTHDNVKPVFISVGNMIDIDTATQVIKHMISKESRIPIPTRLADIMTHEERKKQNLSNNS